MSENYINGLVARSMGKPRTCSLTGHNLQQWEEGWDSMDSHISSIIKNANNMMQSLLQIRKNEIR